MYLPEYEGWREKKKINHSSKSLNYELNPSPGVSPWLVFRMCNVDCVVYNIMVTVYNTIITVYNTMVTVNNTTVTVYITTVTVYSTTVTVYSTQYSTSQLKVYGHRVTSVYIVWGPSVIC